MTKISKKFQEQFLDELIEKAGCAEDAGSLLKEDLRPILQERIMLYIYKELDEKDVEKVSHLLQQGRYEELDSFLSSAIPNFDDFIMEIYAQFEDEYLENFEN